jgi:hypothetical protein
VRVCGIVLGLWNLFLKAIAWVSETAAKNQQARSYGEVAGCDDGPLQRQSERWTMNYAVIGLLAAVPCRLLPVALLLSKPPPTLV